MERRSLFQMIFGVKEQTPRQNMTTVKLLNGYNATFTNYAGDVVNDATSRACIDSIARHVAQLQPKHIRETSSGYTVIEDDAWRMLAYQPNELMNAYDFYYKMCAQCEAHNIAFAFIQRDEKGTPTGLYPLDYGSYTLLEYHKKLFIQFNFNAGQTYVASLLDDVIVLRNQFISGEFEGGSIAPIVKTMSMKHVIREGIVNAIKTTQSIKGVLKSTKSILKPEDVKRMRDTFVQNFIDGSDGSGIGGLDGTMDFKEIHLSPVTATDGQVNEVDNEAYSYYGTNINIIQSKFTEEEWNAFYNSKIAPYATRLALEVTNKFFTLPERRRGNKYIFVASRLDHASNETKIAIAQRLNNYFTVNEIREMFGFERREDGDVIMQDLNHVNGDIADAYQLGKTKGDDNDEGN